MVAPDAVFVGSATFDAIAVVPTFPHPDDRVVAHEVALAGGGPAATAAVAFTRLGLRAAFVGRVGDDDEGERVREGLRDEGVDVDHLQAVPGRRTAASVIVVDQATASRAICTLAVEPWQLAPGTAEADLITSSRWLHVDHLGWAAVRGLLGDARAPGPRVSVDAGNPVPHLDLHQVDLYAPTLPALRETFGHGLDDDALLEAALGAGARTVVASRGAAGSVAAAADGTRCAAPALSVDVSSTLGAGDVFHGALLAAMVRGQSLIECLEYANAVAALSCRALDGRAAIPTHAEALAALPSFTTTTTSGGTRVR